MWQVICRDCNVAAANKQELISGLDDAGTLLDEETNTKLKIPDTFLHVYGYGSKKSISIG